MTEKKKKKAELTGQTACGYLRGCLSFPTCELLGAESLPGLGSLSTQAWWLEFSSPQGRPRGSAEVLLAVCVAILGERFQPVLHH